MVRAERWQYLLEPLGPTLLLGRVSDHGDRLCASSVCRRAPARCCAVSAGAARGLSATAAFATIIVERILDLVAVLLLLAAY